MMKVAAKSLVAIGLLSCSVSVEAEELPYAAELDSIVETVMAEKSIPGLSAAIVKDGEVIYAKGFGLESVEFNLPATVNSVYPISSVSKIFAGPIAMALVAEGKLDLDASILTYLPQLPQSYAAITMRHLLSHTHGLPDYYHDEAFMALSDDQRAAMDGNDIMLWNATREFVSQPGEKWAYSLIGYVILEYALETIEGKSFEAIVGERILKPLAMDQSIYGGTDRIVEGRNPVLYVLNDEQHLANHVVNFTDVTYSAGGLNTSVMDLVKYFQAIENGTLLNQDMWNEIWTAVPTADGVTPFYGLGWMAWTRQSTGRFIVGHEGGGNAWVYYWPNEKLAVITVSNMSGARADSLPFDLARVFFEQQ